MRFPSVGEWSVSGPILRPSESLLSTSVTIPDVTRSEINDSSISETNVFMAFPPRARRYRRVRLCAVRSSKRKSSRRRHPDAGRCATDPVIRRFSPSLGRRPVGTIASATRAETFYSAVESLETLSTFPRFRVNDPRGDIRPREGDGGPGKPENFRTPAKQRLSSACPGSVVSSRMSITVSAFRRHLVASDVRSSRLCSIIG